MKHFCNIGVEPIARLLGIQLDGRYASVSSKRLEDIPHYLCAQINLYFLLHFHANSVSGITDEIPISDLAEKMQYTKKTIHRSIRLLSEGGFLRVLGWSDDDEVTIELLNLKNMYKRRGEGGSGYITFSQEEMNALLKIKSIHPLRTILVGLLELTSVLAKSSSKIIRSFKLKIGTLMSCFPKSARPCDVKSACDENGAFGDFFNRVTADTRHAISVQLKSEFDANEVKRTVRLQAKQTIFDEINSFNSAIRAANTDICEDSCIHSTSIKNLLCHNFNAFDHLDPIHQETKLPLLDIPSDVKNNLVVIAQDYGTDSALDALHIFYTKYLLPGTFKQNQKKSLGGLLRRIVEELFDIQINMI